MPIFVSKRQVNPGIVSLHPDKPRLVRHSPAPTRQSVPHRPDPSNDHTPQACTTRLASTSHLTAYRPDPTSQFEPLLRDPYPTTPIPAPPTPTTLFTSPRPIPTADCPAQLQIWSAQPDIPAHRLRAPCRPDQSTRSLSPRPTTRFTPRPAPTTQATTYATHIRLACSALIGTDPTTLKEHT